MFLRLLYMCLLTSFYLLGCVFLLMSFLYQFWDVFPLNPYGCMSVNLHGSIGINSINVKRKKKNQNLGDDCFFSS